MRRNNRGAASRAANIKQEMNRQNQMVQRMKAYQRKVVNQPCRKKLKTGQ